MPDIRNYRPSISLTKSKIMAKVLDVPTSGSVGGVTHSHGRAGQYIRARRMPCQPVGTGRRGVIRAAFGAASGAWAALSLSVQAAWTSYADSHPYSDKLGQSIKLTGHQMFVAINTMLQNCGAAVSSTIPVTDSTFAAGFSAFTAVHAGAITLTPSGLGLVTDYLLIGLSAPQSGGRGFCKTFWQWGHVAGNSVAATVLTAAYTAEFGPVSAGQRIFYRLTPVNLYGVRGASNEGFIVVT
jgi:hypothetical protein